VGDHGTIEPTLARGRWEPEYEFAIGPATNWSAPQPVTGSLWPACAYQLATHWIVASEAVSLKDKEGRRGRPERWTQRTMERKEGTVEVVSV
jgi:hypothetical protein